MSLSKRMPIASVDCAPPWKRWLALLSVVLLVLVPQAHTVLQHGVSLHMLQTAAQATSPVVAGHDTGLTDDDSPCTLCSVLGSAAQLASYQAVRPVEQALNLSPAKDHAFALRQWSFDQFSRPPPSNSPGEFAAG